MYEDDIPFEEDLFAPRMGPVLHVEGPHCSERERKVRFLKTRLHMIMKLRNCSLVEAYRQIGNLNDMTEER